MKTKLLRKCRKRVKLYKRGGTYYVAYSNPFSIIQNQEIGFKEIEDAMRHYYAWIIQIANSVFGRRVLKTRVK